MTGASIEGVNDGTATKPIQAAYPYESLSAYYDRSSYGSLHVESNVVSYHAQFGRGILQPGPLARVQGLSRPGLPRLRVLRPLAAPHPRERRLLGGPGRRARS